MGLVGFCCPFSPSDSFSPLVSPWRLRYKRIAMGKAKTLDGAQTGKATIRVSTTQSCPQLTRDLARTGDERVVMHAGAVEGQPAFATEGVVDGPEKGGAWGGYRDHQLARRMEKVSMSQAAWLKKRWNRDQCPSPTWPLEKMTSVT